MYFGATSSWYSFRILSKPLSRQDSTNKRNNISASTCCLCGIGFFIIICGMIGWFSNLVVLDMNLQHLGFFSIYKNWKSCLLSRMMLRRRNFLKNLIWFLWEFHNTFQRLQSIFSCNYFVERVVWIISQESINSKYSDKAKIVKSWC